jgi:L-threonylcarbamoyladenylate synthase
MRTVTKDYKTAIDVLEKGGTVALPTDTAYCLAADIYIDRAVRRVFEVKGRPLDKPLPIFLASKDELMSVACDIPEIAWRLADAFWPGGLTVILIKRPSLSTLATAGGNKLAVRVPNHYVPLDVINLIKAPITGTSANLSGQSSPITASEVYGQIGNQVDMIVDGGRCPKAELSTIVDLTEGIPKILRDGAITRNQIEEVCKLSLG